MDKTKKIVAIAMLVSVFNISQSNAYFSDTGSDMNWDNFKTRAATGTTKQYYKDGNEIKYQCTFDNKRNGVCKEFYKNGHLVKERTSTNNGKNITYKTFYKNGDISSEGHFTNGEKNGKFKEYFKRSDSTLSYRQPSSISSYSNGHRHGLTSKYLSDGTLKWSRHYN